MPEFSGPQDGVTAGLRQPSAPGETVTQPGTSSTPPNPNNPTGPGSTPGSSEFGIGLFGHDAAGPLHIGHKQDKHIVGHNEDGEPIMSGHIHTEGYFYTDKKYDAPLEFQNRAYPGASNFPLRSEVHLTYDKNQDHPHVGGTQEGLWRWYAEVPEMIVPKKTPGLPEPTEPTPGLPEPRRHSV